eukprot:1315774-Alexandrium_andersonii.AAC.1
MAPPPRRDRRCRAAGPGSLRPRRTAGGHIGRGHPAWALPCTGGGQTWHHDGVPRGWPRCARGGCGHDEPCCLSSSAGR